MLQTIEVEIDAQGQVHPVGLSKPLKRYPEQGLMNGDIGVPTLTVDDVRPMSARNIPHVRVA